jgi:hypothetical protein
MADQETIVEPNIRWERRQARLAMLKEGKPAKRIRVHPRDDVIRRDIMHPVARRRFPADGSVEWPLDQFTKRRINDGTVRAETEQETQARSEQRSKDRGEQPSNGNGQRQREQKPQDQPTGK